MSAVDIPRDRDGCPTPDVVSAVLNAPKVGNHESLGALIRKAIAPLHADVGEPLEATALRQLGYELLALGDGLGAIPAIEVPFVLQRLGERAIATADLAERLREGKTDS